jgi:NADH-quinone oxidoreductase subunit E
MNGTNAKTACMTGCWLMAGAIGLVILVMMSVLGGMSLGASLFGAAIVTAVLGILLTWILCRPVEEAIIPAATTNVARSGSAGTSVRTVPSGAVAPASDVAVVKATPVAAAVAAKPAVTEPAVTPSVTAVSAAKPAVAATAVTEPAITQPAVTAAAKPKPAKPKSAAVSTSTAAGLAANGGAEPVTPAAAPKPATASGVPASFAALDDAAVASAGAGQKPAGLTAPRDGRADDLKLIEGIGPVLEQRLHDWGIYHFDQISAWGPAEVAFADQNVPRFKGRASRDKWVAQARIIVADGIPAFLERAKTNDY